MRKALLAIAVLPLVLSAESTPIVIARLGQTVNVDQFVPMLQSRWKSAKFNSPAILINKDFIVHSKLLTPGKVITRRIKTPMLFQPIYLVGTDQASIAWLKTYGSRLKSLKATGYLVDVKSHSDYQKFVGATGLYLSPISGDPIAKRFSIHHYPVLINQKSIEQ